MKYLNNVIHARAYNPFSIIYNHILKKSSIVDCLTEFFDSCLIFAITVHNWVKCFLSSFRILLVV